MTYRLSLHAQEQIEKREISLSLLELVLNSPQQIVFQPDGTKAY